MDKGMKTLEAWVLPTKIRGHVDKRLRFTSDGRPIEFRVYGNLLSGSFTVKEVA
jgi:hypothetical protein